MQEEKRTKTELCLEVAMPPVFSLYCPRRPESQCLKDVSATTKRGKWGVSSSPLTPRSLGKDSPHGRLRSPMCVLSTLPCGPTHNITQRPEGRK